MRRIGSRVPESADATLFIKTARSHGLRVGTANAVGAAPCRQMPGSPAPQTQWAGFPRFRVAYFPVAPEERRHRCRGVGAVLAAVDNLRSAIRTLPCAMPMFAHGPGLPMTSMPLT